MQSKKTSTYTKLIRQINQQLETANEHLTELYLQMPCIGRDKVRCKRYQRRWTSSNLCSLRTAPADASHFAFTHTQTHGSALSVILDLHELKLNLDCLGDENKECEESSRR